MTIVSSDKRERFWTPTDEDSTEPTGDDITTVKRRFDMSCAVTWGFMGCFRGKAAVEAEIISLVKTQEAGQTHTFEGRVATSPFCTKWSQWHTHTLCLDTTRCLCSHECTSCTAAGQQGAIQMTSLLLCLSNKMEDWRSGPAASRLAKRIAKCSDRTFCTGVLELRL